MYALGSSYNGRVQSVCFNHRTCVYSSPNMSISLITLPGIALISKLIKRKVANHARAACGCPDRPTHGDIQAQVCRSPGAAYCVKLLCLPAARMSVFVCVMLSVPWRY